MKIKYIKKLHDTRPYVFLFTMWKFFDGKLQADRPAAC